MSASIFGFLYILSIPRFFTFEERIKKNDKRFRFAIFFFYMFENGEVLEPLSSFINVFPFGLCSVPAQHKFSFT